MQRAGDLREMPEPDKALEDLLGYNFTLYLFLGVSIEEDPSLGALDEIAYEPLQLRAFGSLF
jgi:hypothetical protein